MTTPTLPAPQYVTLPDGRRLAYDEVRPDAPRGTVLFLTGLGGTRLAWLRQLPVLGRTYRALALDHRDVGHSDPYTADYAITDLADDAADALRALNAAPAFVVGISMGGAVAQHLALRHPDLVRGLVLLSTSGSFVRGERPTPEAQAALVPDFTLTPEDRARRMYAVLSGPGFVDAHPEVVAQIAALGELLPVRPDSFVRQYRAVGTHDALDDLHRLQVPTLILHGDADALIPHANAETLAERIPGARLETYPRVGHLAPIEVPDRLTSDLQTFLDTLTETPQ
ncbi:alpha/beta fold hydrolase [Deinococcus maricopensis]|uniref:Alpha/beta hydrolase fold protein n=1 Tax=Deinococcus maricopensis (strain DSM 21211 / LMG 22137 / NRRL B-23946 / LB-34) TaxID=709986 RepID=E8U728_DEIML|nr:alpha/beta fold hydrolase [Deinococcus maricopensis]ADV66867.1 alpha/beta hydrolase fold protein [Deinococcus maricopensis DSM 21211]